jgi:cell division protein FtsL
MIRTSSILFWFSLIIIASLGLYRTSDRVQELNQQLRDVNASIDAEKQSLHVLRAEWVYLTNPARIEAISRKHLALRPTLPQQVATMDTLSEVLPTRAEAMATVTVNATPMANVKMTLAEEAPPPAAVAVKRGRKSKPVVVASDDTGHLRDHMILVQRTASAAPLPGDTIGALIEDLSASQ